ncbi:MAG: LytTR family DNA-binding domain-containing protein [Bacteroidales bacterium]|jgi:DNA-binding LytR/AlgR family response regulator|nr:LytTR family DNA-binding domain-containing protein [Bacteroidales bacterium]
MINCIIIDDDVLSRRVVEEFVNRTDFLSLKYSFENAVEAIKRSDIFNDEIDLIFLDIEMPEMDGIDFLNTLSNLPQVIIVSSKEKYAISAFDYDVTDYLLKPVTYGRFFKAVSKAKQIHETKAKKKSGEIYVKKASALVRLKFEDILWVEALENYVIIAVFNEKFTIHFTMKSIENQLPTDIFKRIHRSFIINIGKIERIEDSSVVIKSSEGLKSIPIGKAYKDKFMKEINLMGK